MREVGPRERRAAAATSLLFDRSRSRIEAADARPVVLCRPFADTMFVLARLGGSAAPRFAPAHRARARLREARDRARRLVEIPRAGGARRRGCAERAGDSGHVERSRVSGG